MGFLYINTDELNALMELPLIQRVAYLMGIRPYMDTQTCIVGVKRKISYQSLREILYVTPIAGVKTESPSLQQMRRVVKSLERAGLIAIQSTEKHLILKCLLAAEDRSVQNKADMRPTPQADTRQAGNTDVESNTCKDIHRQADSGKTAQADTPLKDNNYIYLLSQFEKFWSLYPEKKSKHKAQTAFEQLNPDTTLLDQLIHALQTQINHVEAMQLRGTWVPPWKYPANWLAQRCWEDELSTDALQETPHAEHTKNTRKRDTATDMFCPPCDVDEPERSNVIQLHRYLQS